MASVRKSQQKPGGLNSERASVDPPSARNRQLKFKRPKVNQTSTASANQSMLRRVSSVQNRQNCSVVESLQRFVASRSNSAARTSNRSQREENPAVSGGDDTSVPRSNSMERVQKYLKRDPSGQSKQTQERTKPPRAVSQGANKQVRFDIKEGLKEMIKDSSAGGFDAAKIHQQLMDKQMLNKQKQNSADELKLLSQSYSELQVKQQPSKGTSPAFGGSHRGQNSTIRKSTPKIGRNSNHVMSGSSARRTMQLLSPASSSKKQALNLALRYQKEAIESKVRKGEIDITKLATFEVEESEQTPKSSRMLPPRPAQMTNLIPEVIEDVNRTEVTNIQSKNHPLNVEQEKTGGRRRQQSVKSQRSERRAGSIFRRRSESPNLNRCEPPSDGEASDDSRQVTCDGEEEPLNEQVLHEKENQSANRPFMPGQIIKVSKVVQPSNVTDHHQNNTRAYADSSETLPIAHQHQQQNNYLVTSDPYVDSGTNYSPNFAHHETNSDLNYLQQSDAPVTSYIQTPSQAVLSKEVSSQNLNNAAEEELPHEEQQPTQQDEMATTYMEESFQGFQQVHNGQPQIFRNLSDTLSLSEADFLTQANQFSEQIERSKSALHEPIRQDEEALISSARMATLGLRLPQQRLRLIRTHLRNVHLDSFLPLIHEIIQLRDRLAYRKYTFKLALKHPLKASIISDICSRLKQKIIIKVLFLKSQFHKNLHSLFTAYYDLLVKKQTVRHIFDHLRTHRQRQVEKQAYLEYAKGQLNELRKLQAFDCLKRFKQVNRLECEKGGQAHEICQRRKMLRIMFAWKVHMVERRVKTISMEIVQRFRGMKRRHLVFVLWVNSHREMRGVKTKALQLLSRQNEEGRKLLAYTESDFTGGEQSSTSLKVQAAAQVWLSSAKSKSEEIFYRQIQELQLEKEHHLTCIKRIKSQMQAKGLDYVAPLAFDRSRNPGVWEIPQSQAFLSNKEQIYMAYPELQKSPITAIPASLRDPSTSQNIMSAGEAQQYLTKSVGELKKALEPPLHKYMVNPQPSTKTLQTQEVILETKYSVHQALVAQQNLFGATSTTAQVMNKGQDEKKSFSDSINLTTDLGHVRQSIQSTLEPSMVRAVPFKKQTSLAPQAARKASCGAEKVPNQLFQRIKQQNRIAENLDKRPRALPSQTPTSSTKIPPEVQLQAHMKNMISLLRQNTMTAGQIRAKSMSLVMREDGFDEDLFVGNEMSLTDFTQVAMQSGVSMLRLLDTQAKFKAVEMWRLKLINRLLQKDLDEYRGYQAGRQAIKEWHLHIQKQKMRALNHSKTKQVQGFYQLFAKWAKANRQLVYETEKQVRHFRSGFVLKTWRKYNRVQGRDRRMERKAIEFYIRSLHVRALAGLYRNQHLVNQTKNFQRRQALLKFFKRRWLPKCRTRQLLRRVLERCQQRDQSHDRSRYQRQFDILQNAINNWKKRVQEKQMLYKTYLALNHYKLSLVCRHFRALKTAPQKTVAVTRLVNSLQEIALQDPFTQMLRVCAVQNLRVREWMDARNAYVCHRFISHLHTMAVKTKIAKLYVQRKFLKALQAHIFRNNYVRPLAFREHQLRSKAFFSLRQIKGDKWRRQKMDIVYRALVHRKNQKLVNVVFESLRSNSLQEKRERIIEGTVSDFRKHTLIEKSFKILKFHRMKQRKKALLNQVADEFHEERIQRSIEHGRTQVRLNTQTGCLLNQNQDLLVQVMGEWRFISRILRRSEHKVQQKIHNRQKLTLLKCFLGWRSFARYEQSDYSQIEQATRTAKSSSELTESCYQQQSTPNLNQDDVSRQRSFQQIVARYTPAGKGNKSTPALSYINTDQESPLFAQETSQERTNNNNNQNNEIRHQIGSDNSSMLGTTSLIHSSTNNYKFSLGQIKMPSRQQALLAENSDSTLNARAPIVHLSSQVTGTNYGRDSGGAMMSGQDTNSSQNLNQRQVQSKFGGRHQHHVSAPESSVSPDYTVQNMTPGAYVNTSDGASGIDGRTYHNGSIESYQHFGGAVGRGHNYGVSAQEGTILSPEVLSREVIEDSKQVSTELDFEQVQKEAMTKFKSKEPTLVTTLHPYNYEIDLPFKQNSTHAHRQQNENNSKPASSLKQHDYATFSIQEYDPAYGQQHHHQRVFSQSLRSSASERDELPIVVEGHFQSLGERGSQNAAHPQTQLTTIQQRHLGSLTLSNQTGHLHDELESIFKHNEEWKDEQQNREQILQQMASHYQTHLTTKSANMGSIEDTSQEINHFGPAGQQQYVPDGYVESESELQQESYLDSQGESAGFCQTTNKDDDEEEDFYYKHANEGSGNGETQEDEVVSVDNPMDSHILN